jgi:hypothetical protein
MNTCKKKTDAAHKHLQKMILHMSTCKRKTGAAHEHLQETGTSSQLREISCYL